ncbi:hypothetical protein HZB01_04875 [Candidatus Woesearchaeota archaeon]|nr:hypothetical protein [Candidatus Woesearchaeota archaeon]
MGKKDKKNKPAKIKDKTKIDERLKSIAGIEIPADQPFKKDNESNIEQFFRYGLKKTRPIYKSFKEQRRIHK